MSVKKWRLISAVLVLLFSSLAFASTTIQFEYDNLSRLKAANYPDGSKIEYTYDDAGNRLSQNVTGKPQELTVNVETNTGRTLSGLKVYAFTEAGAYTGKYATTGEDGNAIFNPQDFQGGNYKFRVDYLSAQFWSNIVTLPAIYDVQVVIAEETAAVTVTVAGETKAGVKVYLFSDSGAYLGIHGDTDADGKVFFDLPVGESFLFRADYMGSQYWSTSTEITEGGGIPVDIATGGGTLTVTVLKGPDNFLDSINLYLFSSSSAYLGYHEQSNDYGQASFLVSYGEYKVRADYLGYQFWTDVINVNGNQSSELTIPHQDVTIAVEKDYNGDIVPGEGLNLYLFNPTGSYLGKYEVTDSQGQAVFNLPEREYKVRADYLSQQYWSEVFTWSDKTISIQEGMANVSITNMGMPVEGVNTYVFTSTDSYLGVNSTSDTNGQTSFRLPEGDYNFRADYMGSQYWSGISTIIGHAANPVTISTGGGSFTLSVLKEVDDPLADVNCYLFTESGSYLGEHRYTNDQGEAGFNLADGTYKIRVDYSGYQFWTPVFIVPEASDLTYIIPHQDVTIAVEKDYNGEIVPGEGLNLYLFNPTGSYLGKYEVTDSQGQAVFNLPEREYKVRADYLSQQYWSDVFVWTDETVTVDEGIAEVHISQGATPLENVQVYVFSSSGSYLGVNGLTDAAGKVLFWLPAGTYKFRGDYQGSQYWATQPVIAHEINTIVLNTGGGTFALTLEKESGTSLASIPVYLFNGAGSYLGVSGQTNEIGQVLFDLADGNYLFRADYLGYQFWSDLYSVPATLSDTLNIPHQDVTITVNETYGADVTPLENIRVYLFKASGSYMGIYADTNEQGLVSFNLPQEEYKVRADYMGAQHWSDTFMWLNQLVDIEHGFVDLHVTFNSTDVYDAPLYLFSESGSYLGKFERTDSSGHAGFLIPANAYKFRVDYSGTQYWSDVINVTPHEETGVELPLE